MSAQRMTLRISRSRLPSRGLLQARRASMVLALPLAAAAPARCGTSSPPRTTPSPRSPADKLYNEGLFLMNKKQG